MKWALGFKRFEKELEEWRLEWNTSRCRDLLAKRLRKAGWHPGMQSFPLGKIGQKASVIENINQVNSRSFGDYRDTLDDFYGVIFKANIHVAVVGYAHFDNRSRQDFFVVTDIGYYIHDTYDFNDGDKLSDKLVDGLTGGLGIWSRDRMLSKEETLEYILDRSSLERFIFSKFRDFVPVSNEDFYKWAKKHKKGGDFYVFSDVLWEKPIGGKLVIAIPPSSI